MKQSLKFVLFFTLILNSFCGVPNSRYHESRNDDVNITGYEVEQGDKSNIAELEVEGEKEFENNEEENEQMWDVAELDLIYETDTEEEGEGEYNVEQEDNTEHEYELEEQGVVKKLE